MKKKNKKLIYCFVSIIYIVTSLAASYTISFADEMTVEPTEETLNSIDNNTDEKDDDKEEETLNAETEKEDLNTEQDNNKEDVKENSNTENKTPSDNQKNESEQVQVEIPTESEKEQKEEPEKSQAEQSDDKENSEQKDEEDSEEDLDLKRSIPEISTFALDNKITSYPNIQTDYTKALDSDYAFFLNMTDDSQWLVESNKQPANIVKGETEISKNADVISYSDFETPGKLRVTNVGIYKGQKLDLLINLTYMKKEDYKTGTIWQTVKYKGRIELGASKGNFLDVYISGAKENEVNFSLTTVASGTNTPIKTTGIIPYDYLTNNKSLILQRNQIEALYAQSNSRVVYDRSSGVTINNGKTADIFSSDTTANLGGQVQIIQLYRDLSTRNLGVKLRNDHGGISQKLSGEIPLVINPSLPTVKAINEENSQKSKYEVVQYIPPQPHIGYQNYQMFILLESVFKPTNVEDITIKNQDGKDISGSFTKKIVNSTDGSNRKVLVVTADPTLLYSNLSGGGDIYGAYQIIEIPVEMDYSSKYSKYESIEKKEISVPVEAELNIRPTITFKSKEPAYAKFTNQSTVSIKYIDNLNRQFIETEVFENRIGTEQTYEPKKISGFRVAEDEKEVKLIQTSEPIELIFHYEDRRYGLSWRILGTESQQGKPYFYEGDKLLVRLEIVDRNRPNIWTEKGTIKIPYNTDLLEAPTEIKFYKLKSPDNRIPPGAIKYNEKGKSLDIKMGEVYMDDRLVIYFEARIKENVDPNNNDLVFCPELHIVPRGTDNHPILTPYDGTLCTDEYKIHKKGDFNFIVPKGMAFDGVSIEKTDIQSKANTFDGQLLIYDKSYFYDNWSVKLSLDESGFVGDTSHRSIPLYISYKDEFTNIDLYPGNSHQEIFSSEDYKKNIQYNLLDLFKENEDYGFFINGATSGASVENYSTNLTWTVSLSEY